MPSCFISRDFESFDLLVQSGSQATLPARQSRVQALIERAITDAGWERARLVDRADAVVIMGDHRKWRHRKGRSRIAGESLPVLSLLEVDISESATVEHWVTNRPGILPHRSLDLEDVVHGFLESVATGSASSGDKDSAIVPTTLVESLEGDVARLSVTVGAAEEMLGALRELGERADLGPEGFGKRRANGRCAWRCGQDESASGAFVQFRDARCRVVALALLSRRGRARGPADRRWCCQGSCCFTGEGDC